MAGRPVHTFEVVRSEQLTPHLIRVVLGGGGLDTFEPNDFTEGGRLVARAGAVFIHGEAEAVMHNLRPYIRKERAVEAKWASSISGYWRRGRTEETFRQWKSELAKAEAEA